MKASTRQINTLSASALRIAAALLAVLMLFGCVGCKKINEKIEQKQQENMENDPAKKLYDQGVAAFENWDFEEARRCFTESGFYSNAHEFIEAMDKYDTRYMNGVKAMEEHDYLTALTYFQSMPQYLNCQEYIDRIAELKSEYDHAIELYNSKDYLEARTAFITACGYGESDAYVENIDKMVALYNHGMELFNNGSYIDAMIAFTAINTEFEDSEAMIEACRERLANCSVSLGGYINQYNSFGGATIEAGTTDRDFNLRDSQGVRFSGRTDANGLITKIAFGFTGEVLETLGEDGFREALCSCIYALNPYIAERGEVMEALDSYMSSNGENYGCMWIHITSSGSGSVIVEAVHVYLNN